MCRSVDGILDCGVIAVRELRDCCDGVDGC